ncbi:MFS monosaccharide transporter [Phlyctema vagabunda]|uniref:MFS monosaccharide transporter n=1 Tax=Phlyctema vagabunda TaxID=108571 RepID=A0ABR4PAR3_9HELO
MAGGAIVTGWMGGCLAMPYFITLYTGLPYPDPNDAEAVAAFHVPARDQSLVTSILSAGTFFGAIIGGDIADFIGRRWTIIMGCAIFSVGCILETASTGLGVMVAGRLIAGLGVGFISAIIILYMSEIAPKKVRGTLVSGYQFCVTIGILLANCVVYATQNRDDTGSYRIPIAVQFLWAIILAGGLFFLPESPRYFVMKGKLEQAAKALASVRGQPVDSQYIQDELAEIIANHEYEVSVIPQTSYIGGWTNCFTGSITNGSSNLRRTLLGIFLQMMQQLTGVNFIFYFGTVFFKSLGTIKNSFLISLITTLVNVCSTPISFWTIERFGRRALLIWGAVGMVVAQIIVGVVGDTAGQLSKGNTSAVSSMIAFICIYISFFATTWGPCAWVVIGEIFPLPIRSRGIGLSTASNWAWNCVIGVITPYLVGTEKGQANLGSNIFFMWGGLCAVSGLFAYFLVPETKGLSLEQVDKMLEETSPRTSAKWVPHNTFASEMGLTEKGVTLETGVFGHNTGGDVSHIDHAMPEKSAV